MFEVAVGAVVIGDMKGAVSSDGDAGVLAHISNAIHSLLRPYPSYGEPSVLEVTRAEKVDAFIP